MKIPSTNARIHNLSRIPGNSVPGDDLLRPLTASSDYSCAHLHEANNLILSLICVFVTYYEACHIVLFSTSDPLPKGNITSDIDGSATHLEPCSSVDFIYVANKQGRLCFATRFVKSPLEKLMEVARIGKMYTTVVETVNQVPDSRGVMNIEQEREAELWHSRFRHVASSLLQNILKTYGGLPKQLVAPVNGMSLCDGCMRGKMSTSILPANFRGHVKTTEVLILVQTDIMGTMNAKS
ncbi:hypothetical protein PsorP6_001505 [Peronosclerospora sorghi]|uniref:Uncharacterized protein n=1 Tax=Peronosclerospora sorghi TaxID=230839 RepID=A0ACC0WSH3_9STRA|nr:hypothetical protein PsorP6_001505 [Peronosclerospora sorghi]